MTVATCAVVRSAFQHSALRQVSVTILLLIVCLQGLAAEMHVVACVLDNVPEFGAPVGTGDAVSIAGDDACPTQTGHPLCCDSSPTWAGAAQSTTAEEPVTEGYIALAAGPPSLLIPGSTSSSAATRLIVERGYRRASVLVMTTGPRQLRRLERA